VCTGGVLWGGGRLFGWRCVAGRSDVCAGANLVYLRVNTARDDAQIEACPERKPFARAARERLEQILWLWLHPSPKSTAVGVIGWLRSGSSGEGVRSEITDY